MSKNKRTVIKDNFTRDEKYGALIASSQLEGELTLSTAKFNRKCRGFGLEKVNKETLAGLVETLNEQANMKTPTTFYKTYKAVRDGKITLEDIFGRHDTPEEFQENWDTTVRNQVVNEQALKDYKRNNNKDIREYTRVQYMFDSVKQDLVSDIKDTFKKVNYRKPEEITFTEGDDAVILNGSDFHIGYAQTTYMNGFSNTYNYEIFKKHWEEVVNYTEDLATSMNINTIYFNHIGDLIESTKMHQSQGATTEFSYSEQVSKATKVIIQTLLKMQEHFHVVFSMEEGNHDRIAFNAKENDYNDSVVLIILNYVIMLKEQGLLPNVTIIDNRKDMHDVTLNIAGTNYMFTHGEKVKPNKKGNIANINGLGNDVDILVYGHYHQFKVNSGDAGKMEIMLPVMKGFDQYAKRIGASLSPQGQLIIIQRKGMEPMMVPYMFNIGDKVENKHEQVVIS